MRVRLHYSELQFCTLAYASEIPTFEQRLQNSHVHVALIVLADPEHSEQVRHPDDILNLVRGEDAERYD